MNRSTILSLITGACVVALLACGLRVLFRTFHIGTGYANAEQYSAGAAEVSGKVKNLDIHWTDGAVNIAYHAQDTVVISETAPKALSEDAALRWWLDGDTLRVQYAKAGFFTLRGLNKTLTVTLPESIALGSVAIDLTSGDVSVPDLRADRVKIDLTSGDLALRQSGKAERVEISSTSGNIAADVAEVGRLGVSATSGRIRATLERADDVSLSTTSGGIALTGGSARKARIDSTSGRISVALTAFEDLQIEATSGDIEASLPSEPGYRASVDTTSGRFDSEVALTRDGSAYACGDGSGRLKIDTTSGNVLLKDENDR